MPDKYENKILVASNSASITEPLCELLSAEGYSVTCASKSEDAIKSQNQSPCDVMILDISMNSVNGSSLADTFKETHPEASILVITGYETIELARNAVLGGADDYIFMPLQNEEVLKRVENSISKASSTKEAIRLRNTVSLFGNNQDSDAPLKKESLYRVIVESALSQTRTALGAIVLHNEEKQKFEITYCTYISNGGVYFPHDYTSYSAIDYVINNKKPMLLTSHNRHPLIGKINHLPLSSESFPEILPFEKEAIIYPMITSMSHVIGFIVLSKKKEEPSFTNSDLQVLSIIANQSSVSVHNAFLVEGLERNYVNTLMALNAILEAKHPYTKGHTQRVTLYSTKLAGEMGLSGDEMQIIRDGAMLHDIGKIGVADAILNKEGSLNDVEFNLIKKHPIIGETIIKPIKFLERTLPIIRHHHERMDGRGWPDGLSGPQIPLLVRICTIADAYDAMSSDRPYRDTMDIDSIRRQLICHCGTQFDEELIEIFLRLIDRQVIPAPQNNHSNLTLLRI